MRWVNRYDDVRLESVMVENGGLLYQPIGYVNDHIHSSFVGEYQYSHYI